MPTHPERRSQTNGEPIISTAPGESNPYQPPGTESLSTDQAKWEKNKRAIITLYLVWMAAFLIEAMFPDSMIGFISMFLVPLFATNWFAVDSRQLGRRVTPISRLLYFVFWPIGALIHLIATRGIRGLGWWAIHAVGLVSTGILMALIGTFAADALGLYRF